MKTPYTINNSSWTAVTNPGKNAKIFLDIDDDGAGGKVDIRIYHGETAPTDSDLTDSPRIYKPIDNVSFFKAEVDSPLDVFYLRGKNAGDTATVIVDEAGAEGIASQRVETYLQDQISDPLEMYLSRKITTTALSSNIPINTSGDPWLVTETATITLDDVTGAAVGLWIEIWSQTEKYQGEIGNVSGNDITLLKPIGIPFTSDDVVYIVDIEQNKNFTGAGIGPQYYTYDPPSRYLPDTHINRVMVSMLHTGESDASLYGSITKLTNGVVYSGRGKVFASESGLASDLVVYNNLFNIRTNEDYKSIAYDVSFDPKSGNPAAGTLYGTSVRKTFNGQDKSGVVIPIQQERDEATRALFRDDLSGLSLHRIRVIGHRVI